MRIWTRERVKGMTAKYSASLYHRGVGERGKEGVGHSQNGPDTLHRRKIQRFDSKIALFTIRGFSKSSRPSSSAYTTNGSLLQLSDIDQIFSAFCPCHPPSSQLRPLTSP